MPDFVSHMIAILLYFHSHNTHFQINLFLFPFNIDIRFYGFK